MYGGDLPAFRLPRPAITSLNPHHKARWNDGPRPSWELVKLWEDCHGRCWLCFRKVPHPRDSAGKRDSATRDHMTPVAKGGIDSPANWMLAHRDCNIKRADGRSYVVPKKRTARPGHFASIGYVTKGQR